MLVLLLLLLLLVARFHQHLFPLLQQGAELRDLLVLLVHFGPKRILFLFALFGVGAEVWEDHVADDAMVAHFSTEDTLALAEERSAVMVRLQAAHALLVCVNFVSVGCVRSEQTKAAGSCLTYSSIVESSGEFREKRGMGGGLYIRPSDFGKFTKTRCSEKRPCGESGLLAAAPLQ